MPPQEITPSITPLPAPLPPLPMGKFKASRTIVRESWNILKQDKEIMWFPVLSAIVSIIALMIMAAVMYFVLLSGNLDNLKEVKKEGMDPFSYVVLFVYYLVMFFILNFFQAGIYIIAHGRFNGQDLSFRDGINGAIENSGKIFAWSFISATVGVILRIIADRSRLIGKLVVFLLGSAWRILTYFSLLSLVIGKTTVQNSFKDSASIIRKTWGETIIIKLSVGLFFSLLVFLGLALGIGIIILVPTLPVVIGVIVLFIIYAVVLTIVSSALDSIFKLALYEYATTGKAPQGFTPELILHAVRGK
jgi:hypothetical protein